MWSEKLRMPSLRFFFLIVVPSVLYLGACAWVNQIGNRSPVKVVAAVRHGSSESFIDDPEVRQRFMQSSQEKEILPTPVREMTPEVQSELKNLLNNNRGIFRCAQEEGARHVPVLRAIFRDEGIPQELINIALIESGYKTTLKSSMGAAGMWQFMKSTARLYGLRVSLVTDERTDVVLATIAAARHLRDLYKKYDDWNLAIAAYNAGPGTIDSAIRRSNSKNFWEIARRRMVRTETIKFVSKLHAILVVLDNPAKFGVTLDNQPRRVPQVTMAKSSLTEPYGT